MLVNSVMCPLHHPHDMCQIVKILVQPRLSQYVSENLGKTSSRLLVNALLLPLPGSLDFFLQCSSFSFQFCQSFLSLNLFSQCSGLCHLSLKLAVVEGVNCSRGSIGGLLDGSCVCGGFSNFKINDRFIEASWLILDLRFRFNTRAYFALWRIIFGLSKGLQD